MTRILIANMPRMLQELIASIISSEPRFRIVGKLNGRSDLLSSILRIHPEVMITQETSKGEEFVKEEGLVEERMAGSECSVNVIAVAETGEAAALYRICLQRTPLGKLTASGLISAIRMVVGKR